ncbi:hypothetical protein EDC96DRAFT_569232 [Choanephora cucurbitarum]|nr:hypothetical protein EDC96DRAFT_569232 [Choanephora cucurbitarum]
MFVTLSSTGSSSTQTNSLNEENTLRKLGNLTKSEATVESHWIALSDEVLLKVWKVLPEGAHHRLNTFSLALCNNLGYEWMYRVSVAMNSSSSLIMKKPIDDMVTMFHTVGLVAERELCSQERQSFNSLENGIGSSKWDSLKLAKDRFCVRGERGGHYSQYPVNRMVAMNKLYDIANILVESIDTFDLEVDKMSFNDLDTNRINHEKKRKGLSRIAHDDVSSIDFTASRANIAKLTESPARYHLVMQGNNTEKCNNNGEGTFQKCVKTKHVHLGVVP